MDPQPDSLRQLFHGLVSGCYDARLGLHDGEISTYVADLLTEFCRTENIYRIRGARGSMRDLGEMLAAADPVHGAATSFDEEREVRKHIGDYTLFITGMYPESMHLWRRKWNREGFFEMVQAGKESYYIVSQFDLFEYALDAPFFGRLADSFEDCIYGLNFVREELDAMQSTGRQNSKSTGFC